MNAVLINHTESYDFKSKEQAVDIIVKLYNRYEVCLGDLLNSISIDNCTVEAIYEIVSMARKRIDDWDTYLVAEPNEVKIVASDKWVDNIKIEIL